VHRSTSINEDLFSGLISGSVENISISDRTDAEIQTGLGIDAETQTGLGIDAETQTDNNHADQQKKTVQTDLMFPVFILVVLLQEYISLLMMMMMMLMTIFNINTIFCCWVKTIPPPACIKEKEITIIIIKCVEKLGLWIELKRSL
jgi:hypothetical protein